MTISAIESTAVEGACEPMIDVEVILVFASNTEVLNVEDCLDEAGLLFELVPVPKEVNPNCGLAISFKMRDRREIMAELGEAGFKPTAIYQRAGDDFQVFAEGPAVSGAWS